jgi:DNA-binding phage protein
LVFTVQDKPSISNEEAVSRQLREDPAFAAEYLKEAIEDTEEPKVLLLALRRMAEVRGKGGGN